MLHPPLPPKQKLASIHLLNSIIIIILTLSVQTALILLTLLNHASFYKQTTVHLQQLGHLWASVDV